MITLYYSPFFTGECYRDLPVNETRFESVVGDAGLLDFLELRLGLAGAEPDAIERILAYQGALDAAKEDAFYKDAFKNDPLATAKEILRWRDLLVMEGFDADTPYKSPRLQKLAEVEREFRKSTPAGMPERWKKVRESISGSLPGVTISVHYSLELLPRLIREVLEKHGAKEEPIKGGIAFSPKHPEKISIKCFGTVAEACRWAVDNHKDETVICPDTFRLNALLRNREQAPVAASASGDSPITQLFRQGLLLLERPININNLLEYLRAGFSPIPGKYRYALARALKRDGGQGPEWEKALSICKEAPEIKTHLLSLLDAEVTEISIDVNKKVHMVPASVITGWCEALVEWSPTVITEKRKPYQFGLTALCNRMCRLIKNSGSDKVAVEDILKDLKTLYEPTPVKFDKAMAGSWNVVDSHRCFIDAPEHLWWLPCNGGLGTPYPYSFLLKEERDVLGINEMTNYIQYDYRRMVDLLNNVDDIVLLACDFDGTEALVEHPAVTVCKQAAPKSETDLRRKASGSEYSIFKPLRKIEMKTDVDLYPKRKDGNDPEKETKDIQLSATSTETLIAFPFDFVMEKTLRFEDVSSLRLSDITPTLGTVAHYVFQRMLEDSSEKSVREMMAMLGNGFDERVKSAAKAKGEILLLPENGTLLSNFKRTIRESIGVLLNILEACNLRPMYSEEALNETLQGFSDITGSVDFHAELPDGRIVVIDFKYSKGKSYIEKLEDDNAIQLELYAEALKEKWHNNVVARAYYFFPINQLHTDDESGIFSEKVNGVVLHKKDANALPLSTRIRNSKSFRQGQLEAGTLEMAEGEALDRIDYHCKVDVNGLIDIPNKMVNGQEVKATSPFANPTKYPILKNIIQ